MSMAYDAIQGGRKARMLVAFKIFLLLSMEEAAIKV